MKGPLTKFFCIGFFLLLLVLICAAAQQPVKSAISPSQKNDYDKFFDVDQGTEDLPPDELYLQYDYPGSYDADSINELNQEQQVTIEAVSTFEIENDNGTTQFVTFDSGGE